MSPEAPEEMTTNRSSSSSRAIPMSRSRNLGTDEAARSRGVKKQKYPLDDYLINDNNLANAKTTLLSPMSPVSSPETLDVLKNAERLVQKAQEQMIEVSLNSVLNTFDEDPESFVRRRDLLDDSLLYVREIVESKFKESNDPRRRICGQKASTSRLPSSRRNLQQDKFPVKESIGTLNKPLEISAQNSEFSANRLPEKFPFFKKESDWLKIEPPRHFNVFPTSAFKDTKSTNENSPNTRRCTINNTGVIEIDGRDNPHGTIRIQTGPTLDIRAGLTVQRIENVHISPDPSSVPLYNNIATYCFRHEPSTSSNFDDSNRSRFEKHASVSTGARNVYDGEKESQIRSTDYNETLKVGSVEDKSDPSIAVVKNSSNLSRHVEENTNPINRSNNDRNGNENSIENQVDSNVAEKGATINLSNVPQSMNLGKKSMNDDAKLRERKASSESENSGEGKGGLKKSVSINLTPVRNSVDNNLEGGSANEDKSPSKDFDQIASQQKSGSFPGEDKFYHVKSDKDYVPREKVCDEQCCETGSCSRKCERDVEHKEKEKLKAALEAIANIEKIRYDIRDSGVVPAGCTQISEENNRCLADVVNLEFGELSDPGSFKKALENLCKLGEKDRVSTANTNSGLFQGAIDAFVRKFFDTNSRSNSAHGSNSEIEDSLPPRRKNESGKNYPPIVETRREMKNEELAKASKQAKLGFKQKEVEHRQGASTMMKSKINNSDLKKLSTVPRTAGDLTSRQFRNVRRRKEADVCIESTVNQPGRLLKKMIEEDEEEVSSSSKEGEDSLVEDFDLTQPCVSEVDKVLKTYRESMSAICQGTEKLSQLISHHIMKNALSDLKKISPPSVSLRCNSVENDENLNSVHCISKITLGETRYDERKSGLSSIPRCNEDPRRRNDDAKLSEENNSPTDSRDPSQGTRTSSSEKETLNTQRFGAMNHLTNPRATNKTYQQTPANIKSQSLPPKCKSAKNQLMDIQYCVTEKSARVPILIKAGSNKVENCGSKDSVKIPLCTYFNVENGCGKNTRSHRHSNYDIHGDQTADLGLYDMPLLISGFRDDASNNDSSDKMTVENNSVPQTKETELQIFGQIIDAVKNSSQFMKWFVVSLFNGIEIDSVNELVKNLKDAAVHPIIIEQFLVILRERYRERSSLDGSIMTTNPLPGFDDLQEERDRDDTAGLTKINEDLDHLKKSIRFSVGGETTNTRFDEEVENSAVLCPIGANNLDLVEPETNSESMTRKDYAENKLQSELVELKIILDKKVVEEKDSTNGQEILATFGQDFENRPDKSQSSLKCSSKNLLANGESSVQVGKRAERNEEKAEDGMEICQNNHSTAKKQNNLNEKLKSSILINVDSKKNCSSSSNTDKDISFILPCDDVEINEKHMDLFDEEKSTAATLENEADGKIVRFQKESSFQNSLQINSSLQEKNTEINFNSNSDGQSSIAIGKSNGKLNIPDDLALTINLTENLRGKDGSNKCYCKAFDDDKTPKIDFRHMPCQSSSDAVNALLKSRIQSKYNRRTSIDSNENSVRSSPDRTTLLNKNAIDKRSRPSKLSTISKINAKNVADLSKDGNKGKKKLSKKVEENRDKKSSEDRKRGPMKCFRNRRESSDSEKSDGETGSSQLRIKVRGECSCLDRVNRMTNFRGRKKVVGKNPTGREKLMGKSATSPRQFNSPKRSGQNAAKHFSPREPRFTSPKEGKNSALTKAKMKPSGNSNNNNNTAQQKKKKTLQDAASHPVSLKTEDKSQNTAKTLTESKNTEMENIADSGGVTAYDELEKIFGEKVTSKDEINMQPSSKKFAEVEEIEFGVKPSVKQGSIDLSKNTCCGKIDRISERITKSSGTADSVTMQESQTSEMGDDQQKYEPNNALESIPEIETPAVSKIKLEYENIEEDSIIVLRPLNEVDHTFFIAKPNSVEKKIIEEKLKRNLKMKENEGIDQNSSSVREFNERNVIPNRKVTYSNYGIYKHVDSINEATSKSIVQSNRATSTNNFVEQKICQIDCVGGREVDDVPSNKQSNAVLASISKTDSDVSFFEEKIECTNFCTNDGECSRMCSKLPGGSDYWEFPCRQDCPNEEVCLILCAPKPQLEQSVQTNSIDINEILERFTAEDNIPNLKMQIMKAILQELNKFEGIVKTGNKELKTIPESSESRNDRDNIEMENERELVEAKHKPRCHAEITGRRSVQYEEPQERLSHIMQNRKSLILPNVVRGIADMHPLTTLERLKLRSADPLVSGNFNKPKSDKRYAVFNQSDPESSTINLNDPRVREHLASVAQIAVRHRSEQNQSNDPRNNFQQNATKIIEKTQIADKSNDKHSLKSNKNRRGMDADSSPRGERNCGGSIEHENPVKSFESSDLEPGEFLEVRTPFDKPSKSYQSSKRWSTITENDQLSKEKVYCHGFCNNRNYSDTKSCYTNAPEASETRNELSARHSKLDENSGANNSGSIMSNDVDPEMVNVPNSEVVKSRIFTEMNLHSGNKNFAKSSEANNNLNLEVANNASESFNNIPEVEQSPKRCDLRRPQIIDYFLGKTKLDKIKVNYGNNRSDAILDDRTNRRRDNCRQLYMKFNFASKATSELDNGDKLADNQDISTVDDNAVQLFTPRIRCDETIFTSFNRTGSKHWEQTSSDTYSEGEINFPSSCSYSLGEVKVSTAGTMAGRSFQDPDGLTVYVTESILDSTLVTGNSPGEILAEINETESNFSSSTS